MELCSLSGGMEEEEFGDIWTERKDGDNWTSYMETL